jgi:Na+-translocating ferredoxin:NAD+ oxidoreductase RnfG subunit
MRGRRVPAAAGVLAVMVHLAAVSARGDETHPTETEIGAVEVYATSDQALREIFEGVARVDTVMVPLTEQERMMVAPAAMPESLVVYVPRGADGATLGFAVVGNEVGKYRPITFLVGTDPELAVVGVEVLVYRESRGGEVRRSRFLRQYGGKTGDDPVRTNRDIINVAGATLSVNAINRGVKGVLAVLELVRERIDP